jgi:hypothetical protein
LARLIQGLIAGGLLAALNCAGAEFAHRVHLKLKLNCVTCHVAAAASTRASDNLLPPERVCRDCHDRASVPAAPRSVMVKKFNHQLHLKLGNVAPAIAAAIDSGAYLSSPGGEQSQLNTKNPCEACHRGLEASDRVSNANMPRMADCLVCHNQIDVPFSCEKCHTKEQNLRPASHTADFFDSHSSGRMALDKASCAVCHGRKFHCQGCH